MLQFLKTSHLRNLLLIIGSVFLDSIFTHSTEHYFLGNGTNESKYDLIMGIIALCAVRFTLPPAWFVEGVGEVRMMLHEMWSSFTM